MDLAFAAVCEYNIVSQKTPPTITAMKLSGTKVFSVILESFSPMIYSDSRSSHGRVVLQTIASVPSTALQDFIIIFDAHPVSRKIAKSVKIAVFIKTLLRFSYLGPMQNKVKASATRADDPLFAVAMAILTDVVVAS
jgi:hypothetical protein